MINVLTQKNIQRIPVILKTPANTYVAGSFLACDTGTNADKWDVAVRASEYVVMLFSGNQRADSSETDKATAIFAGNYIVELEDTDYEGTIAAGDLICPSAETGYEGWVTKADQATDSIHGLCLYKDSNDKIKCVVWNTQNRLHG